MVRQRAGWLVDLSRMGSGRGGPDGLCRDSSPGNSAERVRARCCWRPGCCRGTGRPVHYQGFKGLAHRGLVDAVGRPGAPVAAGVERPAAPDHCNVPGRSPCRTSVPRGGWLGSRAKFAAAVGGRTTGRPPSTSSGPAKAIATWRQLRCTAASASGRRPPEIIARAPRSSTCSEPRGGPPTVPRP